MFENITKFFKKMSKKQGGNSSSKDTAKERLHLVLMQDRANVSADFLDLMRQEIIDVIKKYIEVDESAIDVRLTNKENEDGTNGAPALYANIPILNIKEEARKEEGKLAKEKQEGKENSNNSKSEADLSKKTESEETKKEDKSESDNDSHEEKMKEATQIAEEQSKIEEKQEEVKSEENDDNNSNKNDNLEEKKDEVKEEAENK